MKYEKFEEWMVGKRVQVEGCSGEVLGRYSPTSYIPKVDCIQFKTGNNPCDWMWDELPNVEFLEEAPSKEEKTKDMTIPWEEGQIVYCLIRGKGQVNVVGRDSVVVWFDKLGAWKYTDKGELLGYEGVRTLFFSEPTIIADTMPPKKPFVPKLKEGDKLMVVGSRGKVEDYGYVEQEFEDSVAMSTGDVYEKAYYSFFKLGEEITWEN